VRRAVIMTSHDGGRRTDQVKGGQDGGAGAGPGDALAVRPPGRPRSERAERAIIEATLDLLAEEGGMAGVSIEAVAARAGVGKTTIYRRWQGKEALVIDALATLKAPLPRLAGRTVREDLLTITRALSDEKRGSRRLDCYWNLLGGSEKHPELARRFEQDVVEPRREVIREILRRGIATGELRPDTDIGVALSIIVGSIHARGRALTLGPMPPDFADAVVDTLLRGIRA
jgi:AcrR family transcriptional regulator